MQHRPDIQAACRPQEDLLIFPIPYPGNSANIHENSQKYLTNAFFAGAGVIALVFVKLMFDMSNSMNEMTSHVGAMSQNVSEMQHSLHTMNETMLRMEKSIHGLGQTFGQGSKQFQQMNPAGMMLKVLPGSGQQTRLKSFRTALIRLQSPRVPLST